MPKQKLLHAARPVPAVSVDGSFEIAMREVGWRWEALGRLLDAIQAKGMGLLLPPSLQLHRYGYLEARTRNIVVVSTFPSQIGALTGLVDEISIEVIVTTQQLAPAAVQHLESLGLLSCIKGWLVVTVRGEIATFVPPSGVVVFDQPL